MHIGILYNRDIYANKALNLLIPALSGHQIRLFHSDKVGGKPVNEAAELTELRQIEASLASLAPPSPGHSPEFLSFEGLAAHHNLLDLDLNDVNQPSGIEKLAQFNPDLLLSIRFGKILRAPAIGCARKGVLNLHSGHLPDYRGVMSTFWAMSDQRDLIGTTVHWILDHGIDTGPPLLRTHLPVQPDRSFLWHVWSLYDDGVAALVSQALLVLADELSPPTPVENTPGKNTGNYYSYPEPTDLARFSNAGFALWTESDVKHIRKNFNA